MGFDAGLHSKDTSIRINIKNIKMKKIKKFLIPLVIILVLALGTVGYGFLNAYKIQSYVKKVEEVWVQDEKKWTEANFENADMENVSVKEEIDKIKNDLKDSLGKINTLSAPQKAKTLGSDVKNYYSGGIKLIEKSEGFLLYLASYAKITSDMTKITDATESSSEFTAQFSKFKELIDQDKETMAKIEAPESYKEFHKQFVTLFDEFSALFDKAIGYVNEGQPGMVEVLNFDFNLIMMRSFLIEHPSNIPEIMTEEDGKKLESLGSKIKAEIETLKKLKFSLN